MPNSKAEDGHNGEVVSKTRDTATGLSSRMPWRRTCVEQVPGIDVTPLKASPSRAPSLAAVAASTEMMSTVAEDAVGAVAGSVGDLDSEASLLRPSVEHPVGVRASRSVASRATTRPVSRMHEDELDVADE